jgi:hypothetical protein
MDRKYHEELLTDRNSFFSIRKQAGSPDQTVMPDARQRRRMCCSEFKGNDREIIVV